MGVPQPKSVSSPEAIIKSIETDHDVYRWFRFFLTRPAVISKLRSDDRLRELYERFQAAVLRQRLWYVAFSAVLLAASFFERRLILLAIPVLGGLAARFYFTNRKHVAQIGKEMIMRDYQESALHRTTLYQLCEQYGRKYHVPSLVDKIYGMNRTLRYAVCTLLAMLVLIRIQTVSFFIYLVASIFFYYLIKVALTLPGVYRRLR